MNPSAPVTRHGRPAAVGPARQPPVRARASWSRWPTSIQSSSISNAPTGRPSASRAVDEVGHRQRRRPARPGRRRRGQRVDAAVDLAFHRGLLLQADHAVAVALHAAERDGMQVAPDADRGDRTGRDVRVEQAADVGVRHQVAVHQQERLRSAARAAGRAHRRCPSGSLLAQVLDPGAEARPIPEVLLDDVAEVVDRDGDAGDPGADEVEHDPLEDRPAGDPQHRLRDRLGQRSEADALAAGHDHRPVRRARPARGTHAAGGGPTGRPSSSRTGMASIRRARISSRTSARPSPDRTETNVRVEDRSERGVEVRPGQERAPQVAVGDDPDQAAVGVHGQGDLAGAGVERLHRVRGSSPPSGTRQASSRSVTRSRRLRRGRPGAGPAIRARSCPARRRRRRRRPSRPSRRRRRRHDRARALPSRS